MDDLLRRPHRPRILVVGDVMLDRYVWGDVQRISPEAPIPVLRVVRQEHRLGGAGSVASMLAALQTEVSLVSLVGRDPEGSAVLDLLREAGVQSEGVATEVDRLTTVKERLLGRTHSRHPQQMMRVDREEDGPVGPALADRLLAAVEQELSASDVVLVSDYSKGVCAGDFIPRLVAAAREAHVPVIADPVRGADYTRYDGCTCITPNRTEAGLAVGRAITAPEEGLEAAERLLNFGVEAAMVTLDRDGIAWADRNGNRRLFAVLPRDVYDITGAGDMVISVLAFCMAMGADWAATVELCNLAGGLEVQRLGVVPLTRTELLDELARTPARPAAPLRKILNLEELEAEIQRRRQTGARIVMTNGCFDLLHPGHVALLQVARRQGDLLVVGLNSDRSVRELKGEGRPVINEHGRAQMLAALECVDYVVVFDETSVAGLVERVLPDVLVKADQYAVEQIVGHQTVQRHGGRVVRTATEGEYSTTALIRRLSS